MPISFPSNPSVGATYDFGGIHYIYNGDGWVNKSIYGISAGTNISFSNYNGTGPIVISSTASGSASGVISFNGKTGAVQGVSSFAGLTGRVGSGITTNGILYFDGSDVQGSALLTFNGSDIVLDTSGHFDGNILGRSEVYIKADEAINEGDPVYVTGSVGASERLTVAKADSAISAKMPAAGIAAQSLALNGEGIMIINGWVRNYNTTGLTANQTLFVASGGGLTATRPTSAGVLVQNIARVGRPNSANGSIIVTGASRSNDVPNALRVYQYIEMPDGFTFNTVVSSFNGSTGPVTFNNYVSSFNGKTGAIQGVSSINGATGAISNVAFTNTAQTFSALQSFNSGISANSANISGGLTAAQLNVRAPSSTRYLDFIPGVANQIVARGNSTLNIYQDSFQSVYIGDFDATNNATYIEVDDSNQVIKFFYNGDSYTFPVGGGLVGQVLGTSSLGVLSWVNSVSSFNGATGTVGISAGSGISVTQSGTTFTIAATASGGSKTFQRFTPLDNQPPATNFATIDTRNSILVLDFSDSTADESAIFVGVIPEGASLGSGIKVRITWMATTATTGTVRWGAQFMNLNTDCDSDSFDTATEGNGTANATSGTPTTTELTLTSIDSLAAGEFYRLKIYREQSDTVNDTMSGDAELIAVEVRSGA